MAREEIILIVVSVLGSAVAFAIPLLSLVWKSFAVIAELRTQILENKNTILILSNQVENLELNFQSQTKGTLDQFKHFSGRVRGEVNQLNTQVRELQNYLAKTTNFEVRSQ